MQLAFVALILCLLVALNLKATLAIRRDSLSEPSRKMWQLALVWLLPLVGAIVTLAVHREIEEPSHRYGESSDPGDDFAQSGRGHKDLSDALDAD